MGYRLYGRITTIALVVAGILQFTGDMAGGSVTITLTKFISLSVAAVCGFLYFDGKSMVAKDTGKSIR